jgi:hypothetical protein
MVMSLLALLSMISLLARSTRVARVPMLMPAEHLMDPHITRRKCLPMNKYLRILVSMILFTFAVVMRQLTSIEPSTPDPLVHIAPRVSCPVPRTWIC